MINSMSFFIEIFLRNFIVLVLFCIQYSWTESATFHSEYSDSVNDSDIVSLNFSSNFSEYTTKTLPNISEVITDVDSTENVSDGNVNSTNILENISTTKLSQNFASTINSLLKLKSTSQSMETPRSPKTNTEKDFSKDLSTVKTSTYFRQTTLPSLNENKMTALTKLTQYFDTTIVQLTNKQVKSSSLISSPQSPNSESVKLETQMFSENVSENSIKARTRQHRLGDKEDDRYWPIAVAISIGVPSIIIIGVTIVVMHRKRKLEKARQAFSGCGYMVTSMESES